MTAFTYLFPLLIVVGLGFYYLNIYRKGKAAGGGFMAGVAAHQQEQWQGLLEQGETLSLWGTGMLWRPWWQYELGRQIPLLRLVWPAKVYTLVLTDRGRLLLATYSAVGTFSNQRGYARGGARLEALVEEKPGIAMKLNPLVPKDYKTFQGTIVTSDAPLRLCGIPGNFVDGLRA